MKGFRLSRRSLLRGAFAGASVAMALPALEAMTTSRGLFYGSARGAVDAPPVRLLTVFFRNGVLMEQWTPSQAGSDFVLPACLTPLAEHRAELNVISGLYNPGAMSGPGGDHIRGTGSFATGVPITGTGGGGPSLDQVAAGLLGDATKLRSLVIAPEGHPGGGESDGASDACNHLSWADKNTPVAPYVDPAALFDELFDGGLPAAELSALRAEQKSVLDSVAADIQRLNARLGQSDKKRLDAHLSALRDLERRSQGGAAVCVAPKRPADSSEPATPGFAPEAKLKLMIDLMVRGLACDLSRFGSLSLALDVAPRLLEKFGETRDHHSISHDSTDGAKPIIEEYSRYQVELFAYLLAQMKAVEEGEATLLDHSLVYFANQVAHGDLHTHADLPVIVAGSGAGRIATGRHVHLLDGAPIPGRRDLGGSDRGRSVNDLFLTLLHGAGAGDVSSFGLDGTTPLELS